MYSAPLMFRASIKWTPHQVIVTIGDSGDYNGVRVLYMPITPLLQDGAHVSYPNQRTTIFGKF